MCVENVMELKLCIINKNVDIINCKLTITEPFLKYNTFA